MKRIVVNRRQDGTDIALLVDGQLLEYVAESDEQRQLAGNIYKGRIMNVLPGLQAAFVDIGLERNAFLYIDDLLPAHLEQRPSSRPSIDEVVAAGQELLVQMVKEPAGKKGARVTTHCSIPGRWLVYMPSADYIAVSRKIQSEAEKNRLKSICEREKDHGEGWIVRTVAEAQNEQDLRQELDLLRRIWHGITNKQTQVEAPALIHIDDHVVIRTIRNLFTEQIDELIVNHEDTFTDVAQYVEQISPELRRRMKLYTVSEPSIFEHFPVEQQLQEAFRPRFNLPSGGYLVIDHTEAMTVIDVNTGKYTGSTDLEQTVYATNLEAAEAIARLIRLRDIGGMIVIDFIDMKSMQHRDVIMMRMIEKTAEDHTKTHVVGFTQLGLLEMTRKKVREHGITAFHQICPRCNGLGRVRE